MAAVSVNLMNKVTPGHRFFHFLIGDTGQLVGLMSPVGRITPLPASDGAIAESANDAATGTNVPYKNVLITTSVLNGRVILPPADFPGMRMLVLNTSVNSINAVNDTMDSAFTAAVTAGVTRQFLVIAVGLWSRA